MLKLTGFTPLRPRSKNYCLLATVAVPAGDARDIESEQAKRNEPEPSPY